jgi:prophage antirepressor-like protein
LKGEWIVTKKTGFVQRLLGRWVDPEEAPPTQPPPKPSTEVVPCLFEFEKNKDEIRFLIEGNEITGVVLLDLANVLGYRDTTNASRLLRSKDVYTHRMRVGDVTREMTIVSESGMYRLIMRSNKPAAERFQDWVTDEVLPSIRKYGCYPPSGEASVDQVPIRSWIGKRAKKCGFPRSWMKKRQRAADGNKVIAAQTFAMGGDAMVCARRFIALHLGLTGKTTQEHREMLGMRSKDSPLDQWAETPVALYEAALSLSCKQAEEGLIAVDDLPAAAQLQGEVQRKAAIDALPGYDFAPIENRKGYKILDLVKKLPSP